MLGPVCGCTTDVMGNHYVTSGPYARGPGSEGLIDPP